MRFIIVLLKKPEFTSRGKASYEASANTSLNQSLHETFLLTNANVLNYLKVSAL